MNPCRKLVSRKMMWIWVGLSAVPAVHFYYVQEMIAALIIFYVLFMGAAVVVLTILLLDVASECGLGYAESGVGRFLHWINGAFRGINPRPI